MGRYSVGYQGNTVVPKLHYTEGYDHSTFFVFEEFIDITFGKSNAGTDNDYNYYATVYYPFDMEIPDGVEAYSLAQKPDFDQTGELGLRKINLNNPNYNNILPGSSAVLLKINNTDPNAASSLTQALNISVKSSNGALTDTGFEGTYEDINCKEKDDAGARLFKLQRKAGRIGFYYIDKVYSYTLKANKAYYSSITTGVPANSKINVTFDIIEDEDDEVTSIKQLSNINTNSSATNEIYNLAGQKVGAGYKGIVIKNGRKIVIK